MALALEWEFWGVNPCKTGAGGGAQEVFEWFLWVWSAVLF